jgi:Na+/H+ antiporter NhaD/arsenite permease-like protein
MPFHPSYAVSVAIPVLAVAFAMIVVLSIGYRTGRAHAAWRDVRSTRRDLPRKRRAAWSHTRNLAWGALVLVGVLFVAAWNAGR